MQLGDEEWSNAISEVMERYAANGKDLDLPQAEREVVADWIGKNLYKNGFAQAIVSGDATVGNGNRRKKRGYRQLGRQKPLEK